MTAQFDLDRFVQAQAGTARLSSYETAIAELRAGKKTSHWIWYILPQLDGLSQSAMGRRYGIVNLDEAKAYLAHPILGPRLRECIQAILDADTDDATKILGRVDAIKLQSTLTLFNRADPTDPLFPAALEKYYRGDADQRTLALI